MKQIRKIASYKIDQREGRYLSFPDVVRIDDNHLLVAYRAADIHYPPDPQQTYIMFADSFDRGATWLNHRVLDHVPADRSAWSWHCPRLQILRDGRLVLLCDLTAPSLEHQALIFISLSEDQGKTWALPIDTGAHGIIPDRLIEISPNEWIFAAFHWNERGYFYHYLMVSSDQGASWSRRAIVSEDPEKLLCEGSMFRMPNGDLKCFMRENSFNHQPTYVTTSIDGGFTWSQVVPHPTLGHRVCAGMVDSESMLVTYRNVAGVPGLAAWVGSPEESGLKPSGLMFGDSCSLTPEGIVLRSDGSQGLATEYFLPPIPPQCSSFRLEAEVSVSSTGRFGAGIRAFGVLSLVGQEAVFSLPVKDGGSEITKVVAVPCSPGSHEIALDYSDGELVALLDGEVFCRVDKSSQHHARLHRAIHQAFSHHAQPYRAARRVTFGNIGQSPASPVVYRDHQGESVWSSARYEYASPAVVPFSWGWRGSWQEYPDAYRRERVVQIDYEESHDWAESGYSGWVPLGDNKVYCVDYRKGEAMKPYIVGHLLEVVS